MTVLVGSVRRDRKGIRVARWIEKKLLERKHKVYFIDPMDIDLPLLDRMYKEMDNPSQNLVELRNKIKDAEGYIAVTPEYNGSTSKCIEKYTRLLFGRVLFQIFRYCFLFSWNVLEE